MTKIVKSITSADAQKRCSAKGFTLPIIDGTDRMVGNNQWVKKENGSYLLISYRAK